MQRLQRKGYYIYIYIYGISIDFWTSRTGEAEKQRELVANRSGQLREKDTWGPFAHRWTWVHLYRNVKQAKFSRLGCIFRKLLGPHSLAFVWWRPLFLPRDLLVLFHEPGSKALQVREPTVCGADQEICNKKGVPWATHGRPGNVVTYWWLVGLFEAVQ